MALYSILNIIKVLSSIIGFLITITILVVVHEYGHYYAARICGVRVIEFSLGFGKKLFSFKDKNFTEWKLSAIPLGGYVKMFGDKHLYSDTDTDFVNSLTEKEKKQSFACKNLYQKALIIIAGPLANYLLAFIILSFVYFANGRYDFPPVVGQIVDNTPAASALKVGDKIITINGKKIDNFFDIPKAVNLYPNREFLISIERDGAFHNIKIKSKAEKIFGDNGALLGVVGILGIRPVEVPVKIDYSLFNASKEAIADCYNMSTSSLSALLQIITGDRSVNELRGTITIAEQSGKYLKYGFVEMLVFIATLSINLAVFNLLPILPLDGGHLALIMYEFIFGKKPSESLANSIFKIGFFLIIFLFIISTYNDIKYLIFNFNGK